MRTLSIAAGITAVVLGAAAGASTSVPQGKREFTVHAKRYSFTPDRIEVSQDDIVKITFTAGDIAHSFTIDEYRMAKRAEPGQTITFDFRAEKPGRHRIYCNLTNDDGCRRMHAELVVRGR